jgi:hypothetical protein
MNGRLNHYSIFVKNIPAYAERKTMVAPNFSKLLNNFGYDFNIVLLITKIEYT